MPLRRGYGRKTIARNIQTEIRAGRSPAQAAAIAYSMARKSAPKAVRTRLRRKKGARS